MKCGTINCTCGQTFYVESISDSVSCIRCAQNHDISGFPEVQPEVEEVAFEEVIDEPQNGTEGV